MISKVETCLVFKNLRTLLLFITIILSFSCQKQDVKGGKYHCPMHPTYIADKPGDCPICGMRLVPMDMKSATPEVMKYKCPMHPEVQSDDPNAKCPKCGMKLELIEKKVSPTPVNTSELAAMKYECPMHPEVQSNDAHAKCPKCGMKLTPIKNQASSTPESATEEIQSTTKLIKDESKNSKKEILFYRNPMDLSITSPVPAKDSMGMDYVPVYAEDVKGVTDHVEGFAPVMMDAESSKLSGVQVVEASEEPVDFSIRTVGSVTADETRVRHVHTKIAGTVEKLNANFTGQYVTKGNSILSIYSPELLASQEEYLRAEEIARKFRLSSLPEVRKGGEDLVTAARRRLELFDVPKTFMDQLQKTGKPQRTVTLNAPVSGYVTSKDIYEGQQIDSGMELFTVTDLSHIWIDADFYEYEARAIKLGQEASVSLPYDPNVKIKGKVSYIYPYMNPQSRTLKVRFDFNNPDMVLKPSMFVDVTLQVNLGEGVVVPDSAVMDTGLRQIVFVKEEDGQLKPREVKVGIRNSGKAQILSGVRSGEKVVIKANFLIDSESRLRSAIGNMGK